MEGLEKIFPSEREAKIAQGLLKTLNDVKDEISAFELTESAEPTVRTLIKGLPHGTKVDYNEMFMQLINHGYVKVYGFGMGYAFGFSSVITMPKEARDFFRQTYMVKK